MYIMEQYAQHGQFLDMFNFRHVFLTIFTLIGNSQKDLYISITSMLNNWGESIYQFPNILFDVCYIIIINRIKTMFS